MPGEGLEMLPVTKWLEKNYPGAKVVFRSNTFLSLFGAAKEGLGIAPIPCFLGDRDLTLKRLLKPPKELESELWLLIHPDLKYTARVRAFVDFLLESLQADKDLIEGHYEAL